MPCKRLFTSIPFMTKGAALLWITPLMEVIPFCKSISCSENLRFSFNSTPHYVWLTTSYHSLWAMFNDHYMPFGALSLGQMSSDRNFRSSANVKKFDVALSRTFKKHFNDFSLSLSCSVLSIQSVPYLVYLSTFMSFLFRSSLSSNIYVTTLSSSTSPSVWDPTLLQHPSPIFRYITICEILY